MYGEETPNPEVAYGGSPQWQHHAWHTHGWHGPRGGMFLIPFALLVSVMVFAFAFKTGLWIPLLLIGAFMWAKSDHRWQAHNAMRGQNYAARRQQWQQWQEKAKRGEFEPMWGGSQDDEKPKNDHSDYI